MPRFSPARRPAVDTLWQQKPPAMMSTWPRACQSIRVDVLQVGDAGVSVGEYGAWAGVYVGDGDEPYVAQRLSDGHVESAVAGEEAYHRGFVVHAVRYASRGMRAGSGRKHSRSPPKFAQETTKPRHSDVLKTLE